MFYSDHEPAHFHAIYGEYAALIEIDTLQVFRARCRVERWVSWSNGPRITATSCSTIGSAPAGRWCGQTAPIFVQTFSSGAVRRRKKESNQSIRPTRDAKSPWQTAACRG
jgi:hypothetical protein